MQAPDLLAAYPAFRRYERNGLDAELVSCAAGALPPGVAPWAFALCKANMQALYDTAWGWNDETKRAEMTADEARYIVVYTQVSTPCASFSPPPCARAMLRSTPSKGNTGDVAEREGTPGAATLGAGTIRLNAPCRPLRRFLVARGARACFPCSCALSALSCA